MDLTRWKVFRNLDPAVSAQVKLTYTWGTAKAAFIVMENDDVYGIGKDDNSILGGKKHAKFPIKIEALCGEGVIDFQCGQNFVMALTKDGKVYDWVENAGPDFQTDFPENTRITQIAAGMAHSVALSSDGEVFSWGVNEDGQLGTGNLENGSGPHRIIPPLGYKKWQKIITVACGGSSTFAVGKTGDVWAWGDRLEVGKHRASINRNAPTPILKGKKIAKISCSSTCTVAVGVDFSLYFWRHSAGGGQRWEYDTFITDPISDVGSSIHSDFIAFSTTKSVWILGLWFGVSYNYPKMTSYSSVDEAFACYDDATMCRTVKPFRPPETAAVTSLEAMFDDEPSADVKFIVRDEVIHAHKAFLEKRSPFFSRMFGN